MESPDKGMDMDAVGLSEILAKIAAGGWPSWIAAGVLGLVGLLLYIFWQKKKVDLADAKTNANAGKEIGGTLPANTEPQQNWNEAGKTVDQLREEARRAAHPPQPPQQQQQQQQIDLTAFIERQKTKHLKKSVKSIRSAKSTRPTKPSGKKKT